MRSTYLSRVVLQAGMYQIPLNHACIRFLLHNDPAQLFSTMWLHSRQCDSSFHDAIFSMGDESRWQHRRIWTNIIIVDAHRQLVSDADLPLRNTYRCSHLPFPGQLIPLGTSLTSENKRPGNNCSTSLYLWLPAGIQLAHKASRTYSLLACPADTFPSRCSRYVFGFSWTQIRACKSLIVETDYAKYLQAEFNTPSSSNRFNDLEKDNSEAQVVYSLNPCSDAMHR